MNKLITFWPVLFRAGLYFSIAALPEIISALHDVNTGTAKWTAPFGSYTVLKACLAGFIAIRAFYDGAAQRHSDQLNGTNPFTPPPSAPKNPVVGVQ